MKKLLLTLGMLSMVGLMGCSTVDLSDNEAIQAVREYDIRNAGSGTGSGK